MHIPKGNPEAALSDTTITVVCYNSSGVIDNCLRPLLGAAAIVIVDNASTDGSADRLSETFPGITILRNETNIGYGRAINQAMREVNTPFALHLNPDAVISPEDLAEMHAAATTYGDRTIICAPTITSPRRGGEFTIMGPGQRKPEATKTVPEGNFCTWFITGAVWFVNTAAWRTVGGFDEKIFLYQEDYELCRRATMSGYNIVVVPAATAQHLVSASAAPSLRLRWRKEWNIVWGHLYVMNKLDGADAARRETWRLIRKHGPKTVFYALCLRSKRFMRDLACFHAAASFLMSRKNQ